MSPDAPPPALRRHAVTKLLTEFVLFDSDKSGFLDGHEMMMLMESRGETVTFVALRAMVNHLPAQQLQNATSKGVMKEINFLEWCCVHFGQSWEAMAERGAGAGAETPFVLTDAMKADIAACEARQEPLHGETLPRVCFKTSLALLVEGPSPAELLVLKKAFSKVYINLNQKLRINQKPKTICASA